MLLLFKKNNAYSTINIKPWNKVFWNVLIMSDKELIFLPHICIQVQKNVQDLYIIYFDIKFTVRI